MEVTKVLVVDVGDEEDDPQMEGQEEATTRTRTTRMTKRCLNHSVLVSNPLMHVTLHLKQSQCKCKQSAEMQCKQCNPSERMTIQRQDVVKLNQAP